MALIFTVTLPLPVPNQFMAIGDWGASYESNDCAGTLSVQQKADATAMVS